MNKEIIIYGKHSAISVLNNRNRKINKIFCTNKTIQYVPHHLMQKIVILNNIDKYLQSHNIYNALHQDIVVLATHLEYSLNNILHQAQFLVLLDELQDSQNIGAIIRSAALFNGDGIISTLHNSPNENSHIIKAACGAFEHIPFIKVVNLSQTMLILKQHNFWIIGMSCDTTNNILNINKVINKHDKVAIVVGNEEKGLRQMVQKHCDFLMSIDINRQRGVDSLNASNATTIFLYEINKILYQL